MFLAPEYRITAVEKRTDIAFPLDQRVVAPDIDQARELVEKEILPRFEGFSNFKVIWRAKADVD